MGRARRVFPRERREGIGSARLFTKTPTNPADFCNSLFLKKAVQLIGLTEGWTNIWPTSPAVGRRVFRRPEGLGSSKRPDSPAWRLSRLAKYRRP